MAEPRATDYLVTRVMTTRWADNDSYGHLNNAVYYQLFDSAINAWLKEIAPAFVAQRDPIGVVAESGCRYLAEVSYPDDILVGLNVSRLGTSSITYDLGVFALPTGKSSATDARPIAARGRWVHVYVDAASRRPVPIPSALRDPVRATFPDDIAHPASS